jgi:cyclic beta-1,2-glucan synthetase
MCQRWDSGNLAGHLIALAAACDFKVEDLSAEPDRLQAVARRARALVMGMDFTLFYDEQRRLFSIGYDARTGKLDASTYDLLASEARLASFVAVARTTSPLNTGSTSADRSRRRRVAPRWCRGAAACSST